MKAKVQKQETLPFSWKDYMTPLVIAAVIFLGVVVGVIPQLKDIFTIRTAIVDLTKTLEVLDQKYQALTSMSDSELNSMVSMVESALPSDKPIFQALEVVQSQAFEYGLAVDSFDFSPGSVATESATAKAKSVKQASGVSSLDLEVTLMGSFENLLQFVKALESSGPLAEVQGFSVSSAAAFENDVKTTILLKIFYMPSPQLIGGVTTPLKLMSQTQIAAIEQLATLSRVTTGSLVSPQGSVLRENPFSF